MVKVTPSALMILVTSCHDCPRSIPVQAPCRFVHQNKPRPCSPTVLLLRLVAVRRHQVENAGAVPCDQPYLVNEFSYSFLRHYAPCYRICPSKVLDGRTRFPQDASNPQLS